jgi:hypothetical protein
LLLLLLLLLLVVLVLVLVPLLLALVCLPEQQSVVCRSLQVPGAKTLALLLLLLPLALFFLLAAVQLGLLLPVVQARQLGSQTACASLQLQQLPLARQSVQLLPLLLLLK